MAVYDSCEIVFTVLYISHNAYFVLDMNLKHILKTIFLGVCIVMCGFSASTAQVLGLELLGDKDNITIPFKYKHNFIILEVRMSNLPLSFLFDTGAEHIILFRKEISDILGYTYEEPVQLLGSDLEKIVLAYISRNAPLRLEGTSTVNRDIVVLDEDILHMEELTGESIDGLIGSRFFRGLNVEINYKKQELTLYKQLPTKKIIKENYKKLNVIVHSHKPYLKCIINNNGEDIEVDILIDTGAGIPFLLFLSEDTKVNLPEYYMTGNLAKGLGGDLKGYLSKTKRLSIDDKFEFSNLITNYQALRSDSLRKMIYHRDGVIGNPLLERFSIIIDYVNEDAYFKANRNYNKDFEYDISGLILYAFGKNLDNYFVKEVLNGSPAEKAGIIKGDIIKKIGILNSNFYTLEGFYKRLIRKKGKQVRLKIERKGETYKKIVDLKDPLLQNDR